jgi:hypothetical protein
MIYLLLHPTPSKGRKNQLMLALGASIVPSIDVLLGIAAVGRLLMVGTPLLVVARLRGVPVFDVKTMG